jgi:hypothetical protein
MNISLVLRALCALICFTLHVSPTKAADKPNILLIVADDAFWLGFQK